MCVCEIEVNKIDYIERRKYKSTLSPLGVCSVVPYISRGVRSLLSETHMHAAVFLVIGTFNFPAYYYQCDSLNWQKSNAFRHMYYKRQNILVYFPTRLYVQTLMCSEPYMCGKKQLPHDILDILPLLAAILWITLKWKKPTHCKIRKSGFNQRYSLFAQKFWKV